MCTYICKYKYRYSLSLAYLRIVFFWCILFLSTPLYMYLHHPILCFIYIKQYYNLRANKCSTYKHHKHRTCVEMINCHPHVPSCLHSTRVRLLLRFYILIIFFNEGYLYHTCLYIEQHLKGTIVGYNSSAVGYTD